MSENLALQKVLKSFGEAISSRDEIPVQLPLWYEIDRGTPNSFLRSALFSAIQGKDRKYLKEAILASSKDITIKYTGQQLNQEDLTVWETLVHLARNNPLGTVCQFTAYSILKSMQMDVGGEQHRRLHSNLIRLTACAVEITHDGRSYFGPLIQSGLKEMAATGIKEELTNLYTLKLNPQLIKLYGETHWTAINWDQRLELRGKPLAQALHGYYSSHNRPYPVKLETLRQFTGSTTKHMRSYKAQVIKALNELVKGGFLDTYRLEDDLVSVWRRT